VVQTETKSIAVLPFVNLSTDIENEFFSDGIAEEILNVLASIPELKVAARTSAFAYKGTNINISDIADELGVNHVLEGSVRKAGNQVRVTAQLIQASDGFHLWSENFDRELTNIFEIQDEIAKSIADALKVTLKLQAGESGNLTGTNSIEAYEHYLNGMQLWHLRTVPGLKQSIEEFEAAAAIDPDFAKAHAGLAIAWGVIDSYTVIEGVSTQERSVQSANRTLELDPENVEALAILGSWAGLTFEYQKAADYFDKAIGINPSFATTYQWYGMMLSESGDPQGGIRAFRKAWTLDPRSRIIGYNLALRLVGMGEMAEATRLMNEVMTFAPEFPDGLSLVMQLQMMTGHCDEAEATSIRLAQILEKTRPAVQEYRDLCQPDDPALRRQAAEIMVSWDLYQFSNPEQATLTYPEDLVTLFLHYGLFEELWKFIELNMEGDINFLVTTLRAFRTDNGIRFQCDPRFQELMDQREIPPAVVPVDCN
jgi:TolB-like protein